MNNPKSGVGRTKFFYPSFLSLLRNIVLVVSFAAALPAAQKNSYDQVWTKLIGEDATFILQMLPKERSSDLQLLAEKLDPLPAPAGFFFREGKFVTAGNLAEWAKEPLKVFTPDSAAKN